MMINGGKTYEETYAVNGSSNSGDSVLLSGLRRRLDCLCRRESILSRVVPGTKMVRYGVGNQWNLKKVTNQINCSNDVFGDPAPGAVKACYYQD